MVDAKRCNKRIAKAIIWILLQQWFWTALLGSWFHQQLIVTADTSARIDANSLHNGAVARTNIDTAPVNNADKNEPVQVNIKEDIIKLKSPDSYMTDERECILGQAAYYLKNWLMANATINRLNTDLRFPALYNLRVLDLRNCGLMLLEYDTFASFVNLEQLYLSHNYLERITAVHMQPLGMLRHLDLAYNSNGQQAYYNTYMSLEIVPDPYISLTEGLDLTENVFDPLERLEFLDLSHTKLLPTSARAFRRLAVEELSLCYTGISIIVGSMMYGALRALDISGNPGITAAIHHDTGGGSIRGLNGNIEVLACENASVKYLDWVEGMVNLRVLLLSYNNINQLTNQTFSTLARLEVLDLSANHISNWRWRIFTSNPNLAVLDLSANNLNVLTTEMLSDFEHVRFLAIGQNNFMCHCLLRELMDMAARNPDGVGCIIRSLGQYYLRRTENETSDIRALSSEMQRNPQYGTIEHFISKVSSQRKRRLNATAQIWVHTRSVDRGQSHLRSLQILPCNASREPGDESVEEKDEEAQLIQLIDYDPNNYKCRDLENVEYNFDEQEICTFDRALLDELFLDHFSNTTTTTVIKFLIIFFGFALVAFIIYVSKWDYVKYFCIILRNATVLSILRHKSEDFEENRDRRLSTCSFAYDVFVSYSEHDRQWILDELLPNLEKSEDINVCLHERDFKVGVSILENIIHCMDQSRTLLLVISERFLLSHWCQFEMHLAQHRLLETRREHLILVILEDIPKIKRPRTLQYLMKTKTYIKWPTILAERNLFWDRLKKAIHDGINWEPADKMLVSTA
ncbi:toll-like receptor 13 [Anopheles ziemanni]|uniref:toll-like receptor 13 n=1 Tax=Anopheles ziemanni TaxID=345580 RepID=UPI00265F3D2B|nr:toll-like receptor 13 [Anopheles ziemanni]